LEIKKFLKFLIKFPLKYGLGIKKKKKKKAKMPIPTNKQLGSERLPQNTIEFL